jgi:3-deoxy-manno-octulosonate cytidylyltransferase (CMP-KDO synthetase)
MKVLGIIPARMAATRFPNKPMARILGIPMIGHCYLRSSRCDLLDEVYVATCDHAIKDYIESIGGKAVMTADTHERASERAAEALLSIEKETDEHFTHVVMIQGDEPLVDPDMIREAIEPMAEEELQVCNLMAKLHTDEERGNPNNVKVVTDLQGNALYFSREPIPSKKIYIKEVSSFRQLGLIAFTREALLKFVALETTPLEIIESVDMNRFLEHGVPIRMVVTKFLADSVDTPEDLQRVGVTMAGDRLFMSYKNKNES